MGVITDLIKEHDSKKQDDFDRQMTLWKSIAAMPGLKPEAQQVAWHNIATLAGGKLDIPKAQHGLFGKILAGVSQMNPAPGDSAKKAMQPLPDGTLPGTKNTETGVGGEKLPDAPGMKEQNYSPVYNDAEQAQIADNQKRAGAATDRDIRQQKLKEVDDFLAKHPEIPDDQKILAEADALEVKFGSASTKAGSDPSDDVIRLRTKRADDLKLGGDARTDYILRGMLPTSFGKPETPKNLTDNEIAFQAFATKHGKEPVKLTAAERISAIKAFKEGVKTSGEGSGSGTGSAIAAKSAKSYVPGGPSIANPGGKDMAVEGFAWAYITTGHMPFIGMGGGKKGEKNKREVAIARAGEILQELGIGWDELPAVQDNLKANSSSLKQIVGMGNMMSQFEDTLSGNMEVATQLSQKFARTDSPFLNRIVGGIDRQTGDQSADNFNLQMRTLAQEYAKIMGGSVSATGVRVSDSEEATKLINGFIANKNLQGLFDVLRKDIGNRRAAVEATKSSVLGQLKKPLGGFGSVPQAAAQPPSKPKADYTFKNGKLTKN